MDERQAESSMMPTPRTDAPTPLTDAVIRTTPERRPAAFINNIAEEGTKEEAITFLQRQWDEWCQMTDHARQLERSLAQAQAALREIIDLQPEPFVFPDDWHESCAECQRYKGHPIMRGICDEHSRLLYERNSHDDAQIRALWYRAQKIACNYRDIPT